MHVQLYHDFFAKRSAFSPFHTQCCRCHFHWQMTDSARLRSNINMNAEHLNEWTHHSLVSGLCFRVFQISPTSSAETDGLTQPCYDERLGTSRCPHASRRMCLAALQCREEAHHKAPWVHERDELKPVGQLSDRCSKYYPTLPSLPTQKPTGSMSMVIQDEGCSLRASLSPKHS